MIIPTESQARQMLNDDWADQPVVVQPIETSTGTGIPDLWVWTYDPYTFDGLGWWLELKRGSRQLRPAQRTWLTECRKLGVPCGVIRIWPRHQFTLTLGADGGTSERITSRELLDILTERRHMT